MRFFSRIEKAQEQVNILNLGTDEYCQVNDSIGWICEHLELKPAIALYRRRPRLDRRQSIHLPGVQPYAGAGMETKAFHPRRDRTDAGVSGAEPVSAGAGRLKAALPEAAKVAGALSRQVQSESVVGKSNVRSIAVRPWFLSAISFVVLSTGLSPIYPIPRTTNGR